MSLSFQVGVSVKKDDGFYRARVSISHRNYSSTSDVVLPNSLIGLDPIECESRAAHMAISHALAELSAKIGSGR